MKKIRTAGQIYDTIYSLDQETLKSMAFLLFMRVCLLRGHDYPFEKEWERTVGTLTLPVPLYTNDKSKTWGENKNATPKRSNPGP